MDATFCLLLTHSTPIFCRALQLGATSVRRSLASLLGRVAINFTGVRSLQPCITCLQALLQDAEAGVVRDAVLAFVSVLRAALALVSAKVGGGRAPSSRR